MKNHAFKLSRCAVKTKVFEAESYCYCSFSLVLEQTLLLPIGLSPRANGLKMF